MYKMQNKEKIKKYNKNYRENNKEIVKKITKNYYDKNKEKILEKCKESRKCLKNMNKIRKYKNEYEKNRCKTDPVYKLKKNIRTGILGLFLNKGYKKNKKTLEIIGCDFVFLRKHLIKTFEDRYLVSIEDNLKELHIDHIIPMKTAKCEKDIIKLNHYSNLQYLYATDNLKKSAKLDYKIKREGTFIKCDTIYLKES